MSRAKKEGKRGRKVERNKTSCAWYKMTHRREKNKIKKIQRHLRRHPNDHESEKAIIRIKESLHIANIV